MIDKVKQDSLFPQLTTEVLAELSTSIATASQLFEDDYLSFDPALKFKLNAFEYHELVFVITVFNSGLSLESVRTLLSMLEKPYQYDISKVYFDFKSKEWQSYPEPPTAEELIEDIIEEGDIDKLNEIFSRINDVLEQNKKNSDE